jgi:plastocyanin
MRAALPFAVFASALILLSACGTEAADDTPTLPTVTVRSNAFEPAELRVKVGDTVRWEWQDGVHNVVSGTSCTEDGTFRSGDPVSGATFEQRFDTAGSFDYFCQPHCSVGMTGRIVVE